MEAIFNPVYVGVMGNEVNGAGKYRKKQHFWYQSHCLDVYFSSVILSMDDIHVENGQSVGNAKQAPNPEMSYSKDRAEELFYVEDLPRKDSRY